MTERPQNEDSQPLDADLSTQRDPQLVLERDVDYARMRGEIEASLFGQPAAALKIGRFTILDRLGAGGMGVVYAAYDDVLDRKIAVKVLQGVADERSRERMLREARAMARLSHPNIVAVHEVGEHEGRVFLAMEFVRGTSLDRWIAAEDKPRPWRDVVTVFREAGRGLVAAHEVGLVHRDFKPHNVMLADDGGVKVLDFGLAFAASGGERETDPGTDDPGRGSTTSLDSHRTPKLDSLTQTGAIVGTPAYMSPEQLRAEPATAASDQFAFAVSLFEALHGQRPFAGRRLEQLVATVLEGEIREPPNASAVPAWIRSICRRALALAPADRFDSVAQLLDALDRDPAATRRRWLVGAATVSLAVAGGFGLSAALRDDTNPPPVVDPCASVDDTLSAVWNDGQRERIRERMSSSELPYAADTLQRLQPQLDRYAEQWIEGSTAACIDHRDGHQSTALFDLRTVCLDTARTSFKTAVDLLAQADASLVQSAAKLVDGLPPPGHCADLDRLTATVPPPDDPAAAAEVSRSRELLARAHVHYNAGRYDDAITLASEAREIGVAVDYGPVVAEAQLRLGASWQETRDIAKAERALHDALYTALGSGHDALAAQAVAHQVYVQGELLQRADRALDDAPLGRALLRRVPEHPQVSWLFANNLAVVHDRAGEPQRAIELFEEALQHARAQGDEGQLNTSAVLANLALLHLDRSRPQRASEYGHEALTIAETRLGPSHPHIPLYLYPLALAAIRSGRLTEGRGRLQRSVALYEANAPGSPDVTQDLYMLAEIALTERRFEAAERHARRGLAIFEPYPELRPFSVGLRHALGHAEIGVGRVDDGRRSHAAALEIARGNLSDESTAAAQERIQLAASLRAMATAHQQQGLLPLARAAIDEAIELDATVPGLITQAEIALAAGDTAAASESLKRAQDVATDSAEAATLAPLALAQGDLAMAQRRHEDARAHYFRAVDALKPSYDADHPTLARARVGLAAALWTDEPDRARALADAAAATYDRLGTRFAKEAAAARARPPSPVPAAPR